MTFRNAKYVNSDATFIDIEFDHPALGPIPLTINQEDYPELWDEVISGEVTAFAPEDPEVRRLRWRQTASRTRSEFCTALRRLGILSTSDAISAAQGNWPASFSPMLTDMTEDEAADAQIMWASIRQVDRLHPFFEQVREFHQMTPEQADTMFGFLP